MRILGMLKADKDSEAGARPSKELMQRMGTVCRGGDQGRRNAGDRWAAAELEGPLRLSGGKLTVIDGPSRSPRSWSPPMPCST